MRPWITWPALAASLVLLNASLTFANVWPTAKIRWESALSVELAAAVLLLTVADTMVHRERLRRGRVAAEQAAERFLVAPAQALD